MALPVQQGRVARRGRDLVPPSPLLPLSSSRCSLFGPVRVGVCAGMGKTQLSGPLVGCVGGDKHGRVVAPPPRSPTDPAMVQKKQREARAAGKKPLPPAKRSAPPPMEAAILQALTRMEAKLARSQSAKAEGAGKSKGLGAGVPGAHVTKGGRGQATGPCPPKEASAHMDVDKAGTAPTLQEVQQDLERMRARRGPQDPVVLALEAEVQALRAKRDAARPTDHKVRDVRKALDKRRRQVTAAENALQEAQAALEAAQATVQAAQAELAQAKEAATQAEVEHNRVHQQALAEAGTHVAAAGVGTAVHLQATAEALRNGVGLTAELQAALATLLAACAMAGASQGATGGQSASSGQTQGDLPDHNTQRPGTTTGRRSRSRGRSPPGKSGVSGGGAGPGSGKGSCGERGSSPGPGPGSPGSPSQLGASLGPLSG